MVRRCSLILLASAITLVAALVGARPAPPPAGDDDQHRLRDLVRTSAATRTSMSRSRRGTSTGQLRRQGDAGHRLSRQHQARRGRPARLHAGRHRRAHGTRANEGLPVRTVAVVPEHDVRRVHLPDRTSRRPRVSRAGRSRIRLPRPCACSSRSTRRRPVSTCRRCPGATPLHLRCPRFARCESGGWHGQFGVGVPLVSKAAGGKPIRSFKYSKVLSWPAQDRDRRVRREDPGEPGGVRRSRGRSSVGSVLDRQPRRGRVHPQEVPGARRSDRRRPGASDHEVLRPEPIDPQAERHRVHRRPEVQRNGKRDPHGFRLSGRLDARDVVAGRGQRPQAAR